MQQTGAIGIAAAGRVNDGFGFRRGDGVLLAVGVDERAVRTERDDQRPHAIGDLGQGLAGFVLQQLGLVIVHGDIARLFDEAQQLGAREHRHALAGVKHERDVLCHELQRVLEHALAPVRRDDTERDFMCHGHAVQMRMPHGAGVESGDLVVVEIGGDERLPGISVRHGADVGLRQPQFVQARGIGAEVVADSRHDQRIAAQHLQVVGDVAGAAAVLAPHLRHQERHVQDVDLVGQDVFLELVLEHHDGVVGHGTADESLHVAAESDWEARIITSTQGGHGGGATQVFPPRPPKTVPARKLRSDPMPPRRARPRRTGSA